MVASSGSPASTHRFKTVLRELGRLAGPSLPLHNEDGELLEHVEELIAWEVNECKNEQGKGRGRGVMAIRERTEGRKLLQ